jgi:putative peptidoglycan lipid II flippase
MPHGGLALANSLATLLEMTALLAFLRRRLGGLESGQLWNAFGLAAVASAGLALVLWCWLSSPIVMPVWVTAPGGILSGVLVYGLVLRLFKVPELDHLLRAVRRKFRRA